MIGSRVGLRSNLWGDDTNSGVKCDMAFYVIVVSFLVPLSTNKFTNIVIPTHFQFM